MQPKQIKVVFLDRDGVVNKEVGYIYKIKDFRFIDGVFEACRYLQKCGYKLIIITNQSGIGRGYYSEQDFVVLTQWMYSQFAQHNVEILDVEFCPHLPNDDCDCRKPKPAMLLNAKNKHDIDMQSSWMIGDSERDIEAAIAAGVGHTILVKSGHPIDEYNSNAQFILKSIKDSIQIIQ